MAKRSRRTTRAARTAPAAVTGFSPCPCGLPATYGTCCGRFHAGTAVPATAELLMRSRYSAFAVRDEAYLRRTWAAAHRPDRIDLDPLRRWTGLTILDTTGGSAFHTTGTVTFVANYADQPDQKGTKVTGSLHEHSTFARESGAWVYVDGSVER